MDSKATLDRALSKLGHSSRASARALISAGRVRVGGRVILDPGTWVDLRAARITVDGSTVQREPRRVVALHKPCGFVTTRSDERGRATVYDLLPRDGRWLVPVGRLDRDTSGLLLLTNDTALADGLTDPESHVPKTYHLKARSRLDDDAVGKLREGVAIGEGPPTRPAGVRRLRATERGEWLEVTLREGRNRQVRRMIEAVGSRVERLIRVSVGPIHLGDLPSGSWRELSPLEIRKLAVRKRRSP